MDLWELDNSNRRQFHPKLMLREELPIFHVVLCTVDLWIVKAVFLPVDQMNTDN